MALGIGETVFCKLIPRVGQYKATVILIENDMFVLKKEDHEDSVFVKGQTLMLAVGESDFFAEVLDEKENKLYLRCIGHEKREYFRIDDIMPVVVKKLEGNLTPYRARVITEYGHDIPNLLAYGVDVPDESVSPKLWKMLVDINTKLSQLLDRVTLGNEGLVGAEYKRVNLSASGLRLITNEVLEKGDFVEVKILMPASPPIGIVIYGMVVWSNKCQTGYDASVRFSDMEDSVREEIIQYTIKRQREIVKMERGLKY